MILKEYLQIVWRRRWMVILTVLVTMAVVAVGTYLTEPTYSSTATLRVSTAAGGSVSYTDFVYNDRLVNTYVRIATSGPVLDELAARLNLRQQPVVRVEIITNTELINITVESDRPETAQLAAQTLATILIEQSKELYTSGSKDPKEILSEQLIQIEQELNQARVEYDEIIRRSPGDSELITAASRSIELKQETYAALLEQYEETRLREALRQNTVSLVEPAQLPVKPEKPNIIINFGLGLALSGLAGLGLVFLFNHFDTTLHTSDAIENLVGQPLIGKIPTVQSKNVKYVAGEKTPYLEAYRRLRVNFLRFVQKEHIRTVMITSADPKEGKSTIVANLAIMLTKNLNRIILVDCDNSLPSIHRFFNLPKEPGLTDFLEGNARLNDILIQSEHEGIWIVPSGAPLSDNSTTEHANRMRELLARLADQSDLVLLDTPALLEIADAAALAPQVDGVVLIVRRGAVRAEALQEACNQLAELQACKVGVIINRAELDGHGYYYHQKRK